MVSLLNEEIMVDTSVWIAAFRGKPANINEIMKQLLDENRVLTCGPILFEIRRGLRESECKKTMALLKVLKRLPMTEKDWDLAGKMDRLLREGGITIPPIDIIIAQVCITQGVPIFTLDTHFNSIQGLRFFSFREKRGQSRMSLT